MLPSCRRKLHLEGLLFHTNCSHCIQCCTLIFSLTSRTPASRARKYGVSRKAWIGWISKLARVSYAVFAGLLRTINVVKTLEGVIEPAGRLMIYTADSFKLAHNGRTVKQEDLQPMPREVNGQTIAASYAVWEGPVDVWCQTQRLRICTTYTTIQDNGQHMYDSMRAKNTFATRSSYALLNGALYKKESDIGQEVEPPLSHFEESGVASSGSDCDNVPTNTARGLGPPEPRTGPLRDFRVPGPRTRTVLY